MTTPPAPISTLLSDRYRIERELGAGGMATVYLAHDAAGAISGSSDQAHATLGWRDYRGGAWLYRVVKP